MFLGYNFGIMLKQLACAACGMLLLYGTPVFPQNASQPTNHSANAKSAYKPSPSTITNTTQPSEEKTPAEKKNSSTTHRDYEALGFYVNLALTLATLVIAVTAAIQASAAKSTAQSQMDADRAWVLIEGIRNPQPQLFARGYSPGIVYQVKIYGTTPARIRRERYRCRIVPVIPGTRPAQPRLETVPTYPAELNRFSGSVSPPGYSYLQSVPLESGPLTENEYRELHDGTSLLCSYCCIEYTDIFGRQAVTQLCLIYDFAFGAVFQSPDGTILNPPGFRPGGPPNYQETT
jgi:hypothetical protein